MSIDATVRGWVDREESIVYQQCGKCKKVWYFSRVFCPGCGAGDPKSCTAAGEGSVYAMSMVHRTPSDALREYVPYLIVLIDADEGFRLMAHGDPALAIGDRVRARFIEFDGGLVPFFEKADH